MFTEKRQQKKKTRYPEIDWPVYLNCLPEEDTTSKECSKPYDINIYLHLFVFYLG